MYECIAKSRTPHSVSSCGLYGRQYRRRIGGFFRTRQFIVEEVPTLPYVVWVPPRRCTHTRTGLDPTKILKPCAHKPSLSHTFPLSTYAPTNLPSVEPNLPVGSLAVRWVPPRRCTHTRRTSARPAMARACFKSCFSSLCVIPVVRVSGFGIMVLCFGFRVPDSWVRDSGSCVGGGKRSAP